MVVGRPAWNDSSAALVVVEAMEHLTRSIGLVARTLVSGALLWGCSSLYIPNTDVTDTPENRAVVEFCERYRKALEKKDVVALLELASPKYYDHAGLKQYLTSKFKGAAFADVTGLRHEIRYRRISEGEGGLLTVDYTYSASYRFLKPDGNEKWENAVEENRLELEPDGESYKIVHGL
jgi:hypothetical protein